MKRGVVIGALAGALAAGAATGLAASGGPSDDLAKYFFGPRMARAEFVLVIGNRVHDFRVDQGRVVGLRPDSIELLERDGTRVVIPIAPTARIAVNGGPSAFSEIARGMTALTVRDGDAPAHIVRLTGGRKRGSGG